MQRFENDTCDDCWEIEQQTMREIHERKTRHYKQKQLIEIISGVFCISLVIIVLFGFMLVFPD